MNYPTEAADPAGYTEQNPRLLPVQFSRNGNVLRLLKRDGMVAMYSVNGGPGVEVVIVRIVPPSRFPNGTEAPWREEYPGNEAFGRTGWYFMAGGQTQAEAKYASLVESAREAIST